MHNKLWFHLFCKIAVIFAVFVLVLSLSNVLLLVRFFTFKEKKALGEQLAVVETLDMEDATAVSGALSKINDQYHFDVEIYTPSGRIVYTTHGGQMMDYFALGGIAGFMMTHEEMVPVQSETRGDGAVFEKAVRQFDQSEFLLCRKQLSNGNDAELRIQMQLIANSAAMANEFIVIVSVICFLLSFLWVFLLARKVSAPIAEMNEITRDMADLRFDRTLRIERKDEIGELATSVNELSASLSSALQDLNEKNRQLISDIEAQRKLDEMRRGFVANVSHELKTPIAIISGYAEGLKLNVSPASREEYCNTIIDESRRMNELVVSILELSRYEAGQIPLNRQNFPLREMCGEMLARMVPDRTVTTENLIPPQTILFADQTQIEQVLKAYLENAAAHTPSGGKITVTAEETGDLVKVSVQNTGSRIDEAIMPQIWQSFYRGETSHKRESSRFGLGLSIVSAIVKMHGRQCGVYNTEEGVCFWFEADKGKKEEQ